MHLACMYCACICVPALCSGSQDKAGQICNEQCMWQIMFNWLDDYGDMYESVFIRPDVSTSKNRIKMQNDE
eukprot:scaffold97867_cov33-Prasinocladus_malaysianus.AAC.4